NGVPTGGTFSVTFVGDYGVRAGGIFVSTDSGRTFTRAASVSGSVTDLAGDPGAAGRLYAGVANQGVYRSDDFGATWRKLDGLPVAGAGRIVVGVRQDAGSTSNPVYAAVLGSRLLGVYSSAQVAVGPPGPWTLVGRAGVTAPPATGAEMT